MFVLRCSFAAGLALAMTAAAFAAPNARSGISRHGITGRVVRVHHDRVNGRAGWIEIRHIPHHGYARRGSTSLAATLGRNPFHRSAAKRIFPVNSATRFERVHRGISGVRGTRTSFQAVHRGEHVRVFPRSGRSRAAREVVILPRAARSSYRYASGFGRGGSYARRYGYRHRRVYRRNSLAYSRVLHRHARRHNYHVNYASGRRTSARRSAHHTLVRSRVAARNRLHPVKHTAKHVAKHKVAKHAPVRKRPAAHAAHKSAHKTGHKRSKEHPRPANRAHPARRKR